MYYNSFDSPKEINWKNELAITAFFEFNGFFTTHFDHFEMEGGVGVSFIATTGSSFPVALTNKFSFLYFCRM